LTSVARISFFIAISLALHLVWFSVDFHLPKTHPQPRDIICDYTSDSRAKFVPLKKTAPADNLVTQVAPTKNTPSVTTEAKKIIKKENRPVPSVVPVARSTPVKKTFSTEKLSTPIQEKSTTEISADKNTLTEIEPADSSTVVIDESAPHSPAKITTSTEEGAPSGQAAEPAESSIAQGGENGFQAALPCYDQNPKPVYPEVARRRGWEGTVLFEVLVLKDGHVGKVKMLQSSAYRSLDRAARKSLRHWVFKPASSFGVAVDSRVAIPIAFVLDQ